MTCWWLPRGASWSMLAWGIPQSAKPSRRTSWLTTAGDERGGTETKEEPLQSVKLIRWSWCTSTEWQSRWHLGGAEETCQVPAGSSQCLPLHSHWDHEEGRCDAASAQVHTRHNLFKKFSPPPGQVRCICLCVLLRSVLLFKGSSQVCLLVECTTRHTYSKDWPGQGTGSKAAAPGATLLDWWSTLGWFYKFMWLIELLYCTCRFTAQSLESGERALYQKNILP